MTNENAVNVDICPQTHKFIAVIQEMLLSFRVITREQAPLLLDTDSPPLLPALTIFYTLDDAVGLGSHT